MTGNVRLTALAVIMLLSLMKIFKVYYKTNEVDENGENKVVTQTRKYGLIESMMEYNKPMLTVFLAALSIAIGSTAAEVKEFGPSWLSSGSYILFIITVILFVICYSIVNSIHRKY